MIHMAMAVLRVTPVRLRNGAFAESTPRLGENAPHFLEMRRVPIGTLCIFATDLFPARD